MILITYWFFNILISIYEASLANCLEDTFLPVEKYCSAFNRPTVKVLEDPSPEEVGISDIVEIYKEHLIVKISDKL